MPYPLPQLTKFKLLGAADTGPTVPTDASLAAVPVVGNSASLGCRQESLTQLTLLEF